MTDGQAVFNPRVFSPRRLVARLALLAAGLALPALVVTGAIAHDRPDPVSPTTDSPSQLRPSSPPRATSNRFDEPGRVHPDGAATPYGPDAASGPVGFGDDAGLDILWLACEAGEGAACDELFERSPVGSEYELFGVSCGNRPLVLDCTTELDGGTSTES